MVRAVTLTQLRDEGLDCDQKAADIKTKPPGGSVEPGGNRGAAGLEQNAMWGWGAGGRVAAGITGYAVPSNQSTTVKCSPGAQWESAGLGSSSQSLPHSESWLP